VVAVCWPLLLTKLASAVVNAAHGSARPLVLTNAVGATEAELGLVMSAMFFGEVLCVETVRAVVWGSSSGVRRHGKATVLCIPLPLTLSLVPLFCCAASSSLSLSLFPSPLHQGTAVLSLGLGRATVALGSGGAVVGTCLGGLALTHAVTAALFPHEPLGAARAAETGIGGISGFGGRSAYVGAVFAVAALQFPLATTLTSLSTAAAEPTGARGTLVGLEHSCFALAGMCGPALGAALLKARGVGGVASAGAAAYGALLAFWLSRQPGGGVGAGATSAPLARSSEAKEKAP
jgi:hypothetical protein